MFLILWLTRVCPVEMPFPTPDLDAEFPSFSMLRPPAERELSNKKEHPRAIHVHMREGIITLSLVYLRAAMVINPRRPYTLKQPKTEGVRVKFLKNSSGISQERLLQPGLGA